MSIEYRGEYIGFYGPEEPQWWITCFNPRYQNVKASDLKTMFIITFSDLEMFESFKDRYEDMNKWTFGDERPIAMVKF